MESQITAVRSYIRNNWSNTVREPFMQGPSEIRLPHPFTVPIAGTMFHLFNYWDTYFTCEGLLRDDRLELVLNNAENIFFLIDTYGFVPNNAHQTELIRSQPPISSILVESIYSRTQDKSWLARAYLALEKEYAFWMAFRSGPHLLNHYGWHGYPKDIENFHWVTQERLGEVPADPIEKMIFQAHAVAEVESGWDFTPRFKRRCADHYAIDLNSLLFMYEVNMAFFSGQLKNDRGAFWQKLSLSRRVRINQLCWNPNQSMYYDYDIVNKNVADVESAAAFFTLWAGIPSMDQATRMVSKLSLLEYDYGIVACRPFEEENKRDKSNQVYQWNFPNAWPPLQWAMMAGLVRYGFVEDAKRLAGKYINCVNRNFIETGSLWEKYNAVTGGVDAVDEYPKPAVLGWTAGTYLYALEILGL